MSKLYFYLVPDSHPDDEAVNTFEAECIGTLTQNNFLGLQVKGVFDSDLDYYDSFRLKLEKLKEMYAMLIAKHLEKTEDGSVIHPMLQDAMENEVGLYAECETVS
ncbi:MAG: hypothetical protein ACHQF2_08460 [Flavobacteriales bacterium]